MGIRERLQSVTHIFQKAAAEGHELRQEEERGDNHAPSAGEQSPQRDEQHPSGMTAESRTSQQAEPQRH